LSSQHPDYDRIFMTSLPTQAASSEAGSTGVAAATPSRIGAYMELTKARLSALVLLTTAVGFVMASGSALHWGALLWTTIGTALAAGCANALNQIIEASRDRIMERTRGRPLPTGAITPKHGLVVAVVMGVAGLAVLGVLVNGLAALLAGLTIALYAGVYTPLKTRTTLNTLIGAVCGATPPLIGWVGASGGLETRAWVLAALLFIWQLPHFMALAWLYREDYARARFAMLPIIDRSGDLTCAVVVLSSLVLLPLGVAMTMAGLTGFAYAAGSVLLGAWLLRLGVRLHRTRTSGDARRVFLASIVYLAAMMVLMVVDRGPSTTLQSALFALGERSAIAAP
jgi:protoheme IX farnesyltransferase